MKKEILEVKSYVINSYAYSETENWDRMEEELLKGENILESLVNDTKYMENKRKYSIDKAYVLMGEIKNSLKSKDVGIFHLKYKNLLEELNGLG
ncbi:MAG: hypothetical protein HFJ54_01610 [Clostridia bacterium]|nr:hypothetical protein [Clostridia bacterium]